MTTTTFTMPQTIFADLLARAAKFAAKDQGELALAAVEVRVRGQYVLFSATDRWKMGTFRYTPAAKRDPAGKELPVEKLCEDFNVSINAADVAQIVKMLPKTRTYERINVTFTLEGNKVTVANTIGVSFTVEKNPYEFPKFGGLWEGPAGNKTDACALAQFDPKLMIEVMRAMAGKDEDVTFWQDQKNGPFKFRTENGLAQFLPKNSYRVDYRAGLVDDWATAMGVKIDVREDVEDGEFAA